METEKCPFIGVDCEYIPLARKAEIAQIESDLDNRDGPALQKAKIEIDRLDEDNRRLRFERDEARKEAERLREAMDFIAEGIDVGRHDGLPEEGPAHDADTMFAVARDARKEKA